MTRGKSREIKPWDPVVFCTVRKVVPILAESKISCYSICFVFLFCRSAVFTALEYSATIATKFRSMLHTYDFCAGKDFYRGTPQCKEPRFLLSHPNNRPVLKSPHTTSQGYSGLYAFLVILLGYRRRMYWVWIIIYYMTIIKI